MTGRRDLKPLPFTTGEKENGDVDFNEYDKIRKIQPLLSSDTRTCSIGARTLSTEMSCPICLDLLSQTMTAKECLHRFCLECITMALQRGNKECPTCRKKLVSKRSLRPDPNFDKLISKIWPDRSLYDQMQMSDVGTTHSSNDALMNSIEEGMKAQAIEMNPRKRKRPQETRNEIEETPEESEPYVERTMDFFNIEPICDFSASPSANNGDYGEDDEVYNDEVFEEYMNTRCAGDPEDSNYEQEGGEGDFEGDFGGDENEGDDYYPSYEVLEGLTAEQIEELRQDQDELYNMECDYEEIDFSGDEDDEGDEPGEKKEIGNSAEISVKVEASCPKTDGETSASCSSLPKSSGTNAENNALTQNLTAQPVGESTSKLDPTLANNVPTASNSETKGVGSSNPTAVPSTSGIEPYPSVIRNGDPQIQVVYDKVEDGPLPPSGGAPEDEGSVDDSDSSSSTYSSSGYTSSTSTDSSTLSMEFSEDTIPGAAEDLMQATTSCQMDVDVSNDSTLGATNHTSSSLIPPPTSLTALAQSIPPCQEHLPFEKLDLNPHEIHPPNNTIPTKDRLNHWLANSPSSPLTPEENMHELPERRVDDETDSEASLGWSDEVEAELLPALSLQRRECPDELLTPRYVRAKHDVKMEHLSEFIHQRAMEEAQSNQSDYDADPVPTIPKPQHFYVFSRNCGHHCKKIFLHETLATAASAMTKGDHLVIFYDTEEIRLVDDKMSTLTSVVPAYFLGLPTV